MVPEIKNREATTMTVPRNRQSTGNHRWDEESKVWCKILKANKTITEKVRRQSGRGEEKGDVCSVLYRAGGDVQHLQLEQRKEICPQLHCHIYESTVTAWVLETLDMFLTFSVREYRHNLHTVVAYITFACGVISYSKTFLFRNGEARIEQGSLSVLYLPFYLYGHIQIFRVQ